MVCWQGHPLPAQMVAWHPLRQLKHTLPLLVLVLAPARVLVRTGLRLHTTRQHQCPLPVGPPAVMEAARAGSHGGCSSVGPHPCHPKAVAGRVMQLTM